LHKIAFKLETYPIELLARQQELTPQARTGLNLAYAPPVHQTEQHRFTASCPSARYESQALFLLALLVSVKRWFDGHSRVRRAVTVWGIDTKRIAPKLGKRPCGEGRHRGRA